MKKQAQDSAFGALSMVRGKTLEDLFLAIRADTGLGSMSKAELIGQVKGITGYANPSTPLSALMYKGLGGAIGWLISKYFGMGPVGQLISGMAGYGIGKVINKQLNKPKMPGWTFI